MATRFSAAEAADRAVAAVRQNPPGSSDATTDLTGIKPASSKLYVYREGAIRGVPGPNILAYAVEVSNQRNVRDMVFVNANTGKVVNRYSMIDNALDRELYEADAPPRPTWSGKRATPSRARSTRTRQNEVERHRGVLLALQERLQLRLLRRRRLDDAHGQQRPDHRLPQRQLERRTTNYCDGVTSDDVVAHEWGHAYTEYTSGLIYQWQPGALNEAYSDIWGETVDMINARFNERARPTPDAHGGQCSAYTRADVELLINTPAPIAGHCDAARRVRPGRHGPGRVTGASALDAMTSVARRSDRRLHGVHQRGRHRRQVRPTSTAAPARFADQGRRTPWTPAHRRSSSATTSPARRSAMAGVDADDLRSSMITPGQRHGDQDRGRHRQRHDADTSTPTRSTTPTAGCRARTDPAFGGAIRDMWNPTCYGDPGKVTDAEYHCTTDDSGGVHTNSGVSTTPTPCWWTAAPTTALPCRASVSTRRPTCSGRPRPRYLGPISDFADLADGLEASCTELTGGHQQDGHHAQRRPDTGRPSMITAANCAAVTSAIAATQLRHGADAVQLPAAAPAGRSRPVVRRGHDLEDRLQRGLRGRTGRLDG